MTYDEKYREIELETDVATGTPHQLISLLLNKCLFHVTRAQQAIDARDIKSKCESINNALDILQYLRICLDFSTPDTKNLSSLLDSIYTYSQNTLVRANSANNKELLKEVYNLINNIREGWDGMQL